MKIQFEMNRNILNLLIFLVVPFLTGCFMMFLPAMPMVNDSHQPENDLNVKNAVNELIQESANELVYNRGKYEQILLGEVKVVDSFISADKVRMLLLDTLRKKKELQIGSREDLSADSQIISDPEKTSPVMPMAVLNAQFYSSEGQIWQAQQLVDIRSNRLLWSGIHSIPLPEPTPG